MASPDAAILAEIARISGAINRAKAAQAGNASSSASADASSSSASSSSYRGRNPYHQPPPYGHRGAAHAYRGRGYPPAPPGYYPANGAYRGSASHSSYRGGSRGSHHHAQQHQQTHPVTRKNNTWTAPSAASTSTSASASKDGSAASGSRHKTLVLNNTTATDKAKSVSPAGAASTPLPAVGGASEAATPAGSSSLDETPVCSEVATVAGDSKVDVGSSSTNPATVTDEQKAKEDKKEEQEDVEMEDGEIDESTLPPPEPKKPPISLIKQGNEIIINGVTFVSDASGRKLVRKDSHSNNNSSKIDTKGKGKMAEITNAEATSTPSKTSIDGQAYVRTKSGNLISTAVLKKRQEMAEKKKRINELVAVAKNVQKARQATARAQKKKTLCRFFQKTGVCARANTCPYIHDSNKVAICPRYLRNSCPLTSETCPLSHVPNAHRMPHCQHFPHCKRGDACPYTHVQVSEDAKICKDFVGMGWCEKGDKCTERHVWECPDFEENGKCTKRGCKLGHVIRRRNNTKDGSSNKKGDQEEEGKGGMPSFMFLDTNPDPAFVADKSITLPLSATARKRSASISVASAEDYSSGEEEAANLVKKKVKMVEVKPKDAMEANDDYVTLVFSDADDTEEDEDEDDGSEAESGLEEEHLQSISRKIEPIVYNDDEEESDEADDTEDSNQDDDNDTEEEANTTLKLDTPGRSAPAPVANATESSSSDDSDESDEDL